jgi:hypothetical protein
MDVAQQTIWDLMVMHLGVRQARRLAAFIECWSVSSWAEPPTSAQLVDDWGFTHDEVSYWLEQYRLTFASERDPTRLASVVAAEHGYVGIHQLQQIGLRRFTDSA